MFTDVVILAGGYGKRLWPASINDKPKPFLSLEGEVSFFQSAIFRAIKLQISGNIIIVTRKELLPEITKECSSFLENMKELIPENTKDKVYIIPEPKQIDTAAAVTVSCHLLNKIEPEIEHSILVLSCDHVIGPIDFFVSDSNLAFTAACKKKIVCYSITPTEPATGYGYIKHGKTLPEISKTNLIFEIEEFKEKPDYETAKKYLAFGNYSWNSGMFAFLANTYLEELEKCEPNAYYAFYGLKKMPKPKFSKQDGINILSDWQNLESMYNSAPSLSVAKAVLEKTKEAVSLDASFSWEDIGSWDSMEKLLSPTNKKLVQYKTSNCFVFSDIPVILCGVEDLIVVEKNNQLLIVKKGEGQLVKEAVNLFNQTAN